MRGREGVGGKGGGEVGGVDWKHSRRCGKLGVVQCVRGRVLLYEHMSCSLFNSSILFHNLHNVIM